MAMADIVDSSSQTLDHPLNKSLNWSMETAYSHFQLAEFLAWPGRWAAYEAFVLSPSLSPVFSLHLRSYCGSRLADKANGGILQRASRCFSSRTLSNKSHMLCSANNITPDLFPVDTVIQLFIYKAHNGNVIASY